MRLITKGVVVVLLVLLSLSSVAENESYVFSNSTFEENISEEIIENISEKIVGNIFENESVGNISEEVIENVSQEIPTDILYNETLENTSEITEAILEEILYDFVNETSPEFNETTTLDNFSESLEGDFSDNVTNLLFEDLVETFSDVYPFAQIIYSYTGASSLFSDTRFESSLNIHLEINDSAKRFASFDGTGDYLTESSFNTSVFQQPFTISFWQNIPQQSSTGHLTALHCAGAGCGSSYGLAFGTYHVPNYHTRFSFGDGSSSTQRLMTTSNTMQGWTYITAKYNGTHYFLYVNGILEASANSSIIVGSTGIFSLGRQYTNNAGYNAKGALDEVMVFSTDLSDFEIQEIYHLNRSTYNLSMENVVAYYSFDGGVKNFVDTISNRAMTKSGDTATLPDIQIDLSNAPQSYLTAYYSFDADDLTTVYDSTNNNYDGAITNGLNVTGIYGSARYFDGDADRVTISSFNVPYVTISAWVKPENLNSVQRIISKYSGSGIPAGTVYLDNFGGTGINNAIRFGVVDSSSRSVTAGSGNLTQGEWQHIASTYNGTSLVIYRNGVEVTKSTFSGTSLPPLSQSWYLGNDGALTNADFNGSLDEVMIFSKALNATEIAQIYNSQYKRFKSEGMAGFVPIGLNASANAVNISINNTQINYNTSLQSRVGYWEENNGYNLGEGEAVFDGNGDSVITTADIDNMNITGKTFIAWVRHNNLDNFQTYIAADVQNTAVQNIFFRMQDSGKVRYAYAWTSRNRRGYMTDSVVLSENTWHFVAVTQEGHSAAKIYVDGSEVPSSLVDSPNVAGFPENAGYWIGGTKDYGYNMNGSIDEVMIFNRTLNATEIENIYNQNRSYYNGNITGLVSYYTFDNHKSFYSDSLGVNNGTKAGDTKVVLSNNSLTNGLVGYWTGDGNANDYSGNGNHGTFVGDATTSAGLFNNAFSFDGDGDHVATSAFSNWDNMESFTYSLWFKTTQSANADILMKGLTASSADKIIQLLSDGEIRFLDRKVSGTFFVDSGTFHNDGNWHHVVARKNGNDSKYDLYINNVLKATFTNAVVSNDDSDTGFYLGERANGASDFSGSIDEVLIWNRTLSADEIKEIYNKGLANFEYSKWKDLQDGNVSFILPYNATTIRPEFKLMGDTWYTPYLSSNFVIDTDSGEILLSANYNANTTAQGGHQQDFIYASITGLPEDLIDTITIYLYNETAVLNTTTIEASTANINFTNLENGKYILNATIEFVTKDIFIVDARNIILDTIPPQAVVIDPENNIIVRNEPEVNFTVNITDNVEIENATVYIYNQSEGSLFRNITINAINTIDSIVSTITGLVEGTFTWFYRILDTAGNMFQTENRTITFSKPPTIEITNLTNTTYYISTTTANMLLNFTAFDGNDIDQLWFYNKNTNTNISYTPGIPQEITYPIGNNYVIFYANDSVGDITQALIQFNLSSLNLHSISNNISLPDELDDVIVQVNLTSYSGVANCTLAGDLGTYQNQTLADGNSLLFFNTGKQLAGTYFYNISCITDIEPQQKVLQNLVTVTKQINVYPSSIYLTPNPPEIGQNSTITALVHSSHRDVTNVTTQFYIGSENIGNATIPAIAANSQAPASINYVFTQQNYVPIKVVVTSSVNESSFTDNNLTRAFPIGFNLTEGGIAISNINITPNPVSQYDSYYVSGYANYNFSGLQPVIGALVSITVAGDNLSVPETTYTTATDNEGFFNYSTGIIALQNVGIYSVSIVVSDGSLLSTINSSIPLEVNFPENVTAVDFVTSEIFFNGNTQGSSVTPYVNDSINITGLIRNIGVNGTVTASLFRGSILIAEENITLNSGSSYNWSNVVDVFAAGTNHFTVALDRFGTTNDSRLNNNNRTESAYVYTNLSDLYIVNPYSTFSSSQFVANTPVNITAHIRNREGKDAENVTLDFYEDDILIYSTLIPLIRRFNNQTETKTITHTFSTAGTKNISVTLNPGQDIEETNYANNNYTLTSIPVQASANPDFVIQDIASTDYFYSYADGTQNIFADIPLNLSLYVRNIGSASFVGAVNVTFLLNGLYANVTTITNLSINEQKIVTFTYLFPKEMILSGQLQNITAIINPLNFSNESNFLNNQRSEQFYLVLPELHYNPDFNPFIVNDSTPLIGTAVTLSGYIDNLNQNIDAKNIVVSFNTTFNNTEYHLGNKTVNFTKNQQTYVSFLWNNVSPEGSHTIKISVNPSYRQYERRSTNPWGYDGLENSKTQAITVDSGAPIITNITLNYKTASASFIEDIDPNTTIIFNANVTDSNGVQEVIFQYANDSDWVSIPMQNNTPNIYFGNITTAPYDQTYFFRILATDSTNRTRTTNNFTFESRWDCTWNLSTTGNLNSETPTGGKSQFLTLGEFIVTNTGDLEYPGECMLGFGRDVQENPLLTSDTISLNFSFQYLVDALTNSFEFGLRYQINDTNITRFSVPARENKTILVGAYFPPAVTAYKEHIYFNLSSNVTDTYYNRSSETIRATVVLTPGAYLDSRIESPVSDQLIPLVPGNVSFIAYVKNLVSGSDLNNTAYNVSFNWTLPNEIAGLFIYDNLTYFTEVLNDTEKRYINISLSLEESDLETLTLTNYTLYTFAYGFENSTGNLSLIEHTDGSILSDEILIQFYCPEINENALAPACRQENSVIVNQPSSGGGGSTGGSAGSSLRPEQIQKLFQTDEYYELVRGKEDSFTLIVENSFSGTMEGVSARITGFLEQYLKITPNYLLSIGINDSQNYTITIAAPEYFVDGEYFLNLSISAVINTSRLLENNFTAYRYEYINETRRITLLVTSVSREDALDYMNQAESIVSQMSKENLSVRQLNKILGQLDLSLQQRKYAEVKLLAEEIIKAQQGATQTLEVLNEVESGVMDATLSGLEVPETLRLVLLARATFERGDFVTALQRAQDAKVTLALETVGKINLVVFVKRNWGILLGIIIILSLLLYAGYLITKYFLLTKKLKLLGQERDIILQLIKQAQIECFKYNKISMEQYAESLIHYDEKISAVVKKIIELNTEKKFLFKIFASQIIMLKYEKDNLIKNIQETQDKYINSYKLETRLYESRMKTYTERLAEIEETLVNLEVAQSLKKAKISRT